MLPDINTLLKPRPKKYRNLVKHIQRDLSFYDYDSSSITDEDIFLDLTSSRGTSRFLGTFSKRGIEFVLNKFGYFDHLNSVGLSNPNIVLDTSDPFKHRIQVLHKIDGKDIISGELVMRRSFFNTPPQENKTYPPADLVLVEWFLLQNPLKKFSRMRPQLPGQEYPGLGFASNIFEVFYWMTKRLKADGVVLIPNYLHTGIFYGRRFVFMNAKKQGVITAIDNMRNPSVRLNQLSWACAEGQLVDVKKDEVLIWKPSPMILPVSRMAKVYFGTDYYLKQVKSAETNTQLRINQGYKKKYNSNWKAVL